MKLISIKKIRRNDVSHGLLLVLELHDDLLHVLVVDVHQGVHEKKNLLFIKDAHSSCPYLSNKKKISLLSQIKVPKAPCTKLWNQSAEVPPPLNHLQEYGKQIIKDDLITMGATILLHKPFSTMIRKKPLLNSAMYI